MDDESAVSLETALPLFPAAGMSVATMSAAEHASWMERAPHKRLMLFSGRSNPALGEDIAARIGIELGDVLLKTFTNGEVYVRYEESIRGADLFIVQSCSSPTNDSLMELMIMINAARLASAKRITAVMPWYPYSRQDKKSSPREPITANYDGSSKQRTTIGSNVHTSCDNVFVAPVTIGDGAWTAAGSVITDDVPSDALAIARVHQKNIEGYGRRKRS